MPGLAGVEAAWQAAEAWMTFVMWAVMMAAMMLPAAIPMVLAFAAMNRQRLRHHLKREKRGESNPHQRPK